MDEENVIRKRVSSETLKKYLQEISKLERITPEEEKILGDRIREGDKEALQRMVEANLRFVVSYANMQTITPGTACAD